MPARSPDEPPDAASAHAPDAHALERVPARLRARFDAVVARTDAFAAAHLDAEYAALCRRMAAALARLRPPPLERGAARTWAAAVVHAVGWVNFLADPSQVPHLTTPELARRTGVGQSTLAAYLRVVRDALDLVRMDPAWTRPSRLADNPLAWLVEMDGLVFDVRDAPRHVQEAALRQGAIPFLPGDGRFGDGPPDDEDGEPLGDTGGDAATAAGPADPGLADLLDALRAEAHDAVGRTLAERPSAGLDDLNAALAAVAGGYNRRPQAELGGLSPAAVHRLLAADWLAPDGAVRLDATLPLADVATARTLRGARWLLARLAAGGGGRATPKGNLPRAVVAAFVAGGLAANPAADLGADPVAPEPVGRNEEDVWPLHYARLLLELAGLVKRRRGVWSGTRRGVAHVAEDRAGALFATLVRTHFRDLDLAYLDGVGPAPGFQGTAAYTLYRFGRVGGGWRRADELTREVLLPSVRPELPSRAWFGGTFDALALILETRVLRPLVGFGLAEQQLAPPQAAPQAAPDATRGPGAAWARARFRTTPLFGRLFTFDVGPDAG